MNHPDRESTWDWVSARQACSIEAFFERLYLGTVKNVEVRNAQATPGAPWQLQVQQVDPSLFSVLRLLKYGATAVVRVKRNRTEIRVDGQNIDVKFIGTVTMDDEGECRLLVDGQALDEWQVLKRAFESLFFDVDP
jgi:hypothetical protein